MRAHSLPDLGILLLYALSYALWRHLLGPGFISYNLLDFSHFLNPEWLKNDLPGSLIYLHSQPPLMNLLIGIIFKCTPFYYWMTFRTLYFITGALAVLCIFRTLQLLGVRTVIAFFTVAVLTLSPTLYIFGTWYYATHLEFCISACMIHAIAHYCLRPDERHVSMLGAFICFALLGLMRPQWHLFLFIALAVAMAHIGGRGIRKTALLTSLIFLLPIAGWYSKNLMVFGFWGGSSWMGANIAQVAHKMPSSEPMKEAGKISADFPGDLVMEHIVQRIVPPAGLPPVLGPEKTDDVKFQMFAKMQHQHYLLYNLNYLGVIASARQDMRDAMTIIAAHPLEYLGVVFRQLMMAGLTPSFMANSLNLIDGEVAMRYYIGETELSLALFAMGAFALYMLVPALVFFETLRMHPGPKRQFIFICLGLMAFMMVTACALNGFEQERMRWGWQAIYVIFSAIFLENIWKWWNNQRHGRITEHS